VAKLKELRPGDEIGFPYGFELSRDAKRADVLTNKLEIDGVEGTACEFNAWGNGNDKLQIGGHLYWKLKEQPQEIHEIFKHSRTRLVLVDPRSKREMSMTCDQRVDLDLLRDADFDIPWKRDRPVRVERLGDSGDTEETDSAKGRSAM
jgi:hypothetical protein